MRASIKLPQGTVVLDVAHACRAALEEFLTLDANNQNALSEWLSGSYRNATRFAPARHDLAVSHHVVSSTALAEIICYAQGEIRDAIEAAAAPGAERLLARLPDVVDVVPVHDSFGDRGFAPLDVPRSRLATRVLAVLLADYLTRPDDYVARRGPGTARRRSTRMLALG